MRSVLTPAIMQDKICYLAQTTASCYASSTPPMTTQLAPKKDLPALPPILTGTQTPAVRQRVEEFFSSLASIFESWVSRRQSKHTQRAYREDVMAFVKCQA